MQEILYFGDSLNDLDLINSEYITIAMANALDIIKEKAKFITDSNDNDGIVNTSPIP